MRSENTKSSTIKVRAVRKGDGSEQSNQAGRAGVTSTERAPDRRAYKEATWLRKTLSISHLQTAHVLRESDLSDWKTGDYKQLKVCAENEIDWTE